ncbi:hypothetical protein E2C01_074395 [Portunus trituberculatus]|uniref:Uncharacterized protein n=1 Tax=Portunus trituberculatus TaxID=210409 RepID=A0A5B7ICA7_PORTR|nr:hypothetical protein [Portunus trituberculatus]
MQRGRSVYAFQHNMNTTSQVITHHLLVDKWNTSRRYSNIKRQAKGTSFIHLRSGLQLHAFEIFQLFLAQQLIFSKFSSHLPLLHPTSFLPAHSTRPLFTTRTPPAAPPALHAGVSAREKT